MGRRVRSGLLVGLIVAVVGLGCGSADPIGSPAPVTTAAEPVEPVEAQGSPEGPPSSVPASVGPAQPATTSTTTTTTTTTTTATRATGTGQPPTGPSLPEGADPSSSGCATAFDGWVQVGDRRAMVHRPASASPMPAWLVLHGYTGTPDSIETTSGVTPFARNVGAVSVYPEGTPVPGQSGFQWAAGTAIYSGGGDDVGFLGALLDVLVAHHCVDPTAVILSGESNGGAMVLRAACDPSLGGRLALVAPVIAAVDDGAIATCGSGEPVPLVAVASVGDATVSISGDHPPGRTPLLAPEAWFGRVARQLNRCGETTTESAVGIHRRLDALGCDAPSTYVAVADGTHTWPGGPQGTAGLAVGTFDTNGLVWAQLAR